MIPIYERAHSHLKSTFFILEACNRIPLSMLIEYKFGSGSPTAQPEWESIKMDGSRAEHTKNAPATKKRIPEERRAPSTGEGSW